MARLFRKLLWSLAILLTAGLAKIPFESHLRGQLQTAGFLPVQNEVSLVDRLGVQSFVGVLGGLRYMVATGLSLKAIGLWSEYRWPEVEETYRIIHLLQPRDTEAWAFGAWNMAYNASAWHLYDDRENAEALRERLAREYIDKGAAMLEEGIRWNPESIRLYRDLGALHREKNDDHCAAAAIYGRAIQVEGAPAYLRRFYVYALAKCPGKELEAHARAMELYAEAVRVLKTQGVSIWTPSLIETVRDLEEKLNVPADERIPERLDPLTLKIITPIRP